MYSCTPSSPVWRGTFPELNELFDSWGFWEIVLRSLGFMPYLPIILEFSVRGTMNWGDLDDEFVEAECIWTCSLTY